MAPALWGSQAPIRSSPSRDHRGRAGRARAPFRSSRPGGSAAISTSATWGWAPRSTSRGGRGGAVLGGRHPRRAGDGEVCGTAIESPMDVVLTLDLVKGREPSDAALRDERARDAPPRRQGLRGDDRDRART
jgi:amidase